MRAEKESAVAAVVEPGNDDRSAESKAGVMLLKRQTPKAERIVLPRVRIQRFIAEEIESAPLVLVRTAARKQVYPAACSASILSRELIPDNLHLCDRFERWREALASATVIVVVETVYRDVVGIRRAAGEGKIPGF